ncbi:MAG: hypothetical protein IT372_29610 [Polyangiaceae bacterium]|nr:hypothetical protein [Polyangiaceae bacterium]
MTNAPAVPVHSPEPMRPAYEAILARLDGATGSPLPAEIVPLLKEAAAELSRRRPSPLLRGDSASWASGIAIAICAENGLFAPRRRGSKPLTPADLARALGVAPSTAASKAAEARRHLRIAPANTPPPDLRWCLPAVRAERQRAQAAAGALAGNAPLPLAPLRRALTQAARAVSALSEAAMLAAAPPLRAPAARKRPATGGSRPRAAA